MRLSQLFTKTTKSVPADETSKNARLLIQAGYVYKVMAGVYAYTPLGLRVLENIKQIVREEMDAIGGQELIMSSLQKRSTWEETGRWDDEVVDVWFKSKLKDGTDVGFGWSHEEAIIEMVKQYLSSYKDLPINVYQFQTKMRNELRAKSGIMRGREFVMKDMYSCSLDAAQHDAFYQATIDAYNRVYDRLGIGEDTFVTFASGGAFTKYSHEFQTICDAGEDVIVKTSEGTWHNLEIAVSKAGKTNMVEEFKSYEEQERPGITGVQALLEAFDIPIEKSTKTLIYTTDTGEAIFAALRSDYEVNEDKLIDVASCSSLALATEETVRNLTGAEIGYAGIVNIPEGVRVFLDDSLEDLSNFETGANKTNYHAINVNFDRDVALPGRFYDFKVAREGDVDPITGEELVFAKSAEVGNIFNFGTHKSEQTNFVFTNEQGQQQYVHLGSYGIGITRVMGVIVEKFADDRGIVWPEGVAPATIYLARLGATPDVSAAADNLYEELTAKNIQVLYDDRDARAGEKFADADLLGIPYRVVISSKTVAANTYEFKARTADTSENINRQELIDKCAS
ncbi:MAG TPA: proline--tRNA ligase [Candidatus Limnocylindrales bacterium]|nr:proline--tRNA ligase [Candidatus Limnocylindrales bacterium]